MENSSIVIFFFSIKYLNLANSGCSFDFLYFLAMLSPR
nr:MAG TPA: hypothetical protein [Caudoviricetes sp.]